MIESLNAIRSLGLAPVFEDLYFARPVPEHLNIYMTYPWAFRDSTVADWEPITEGRLIPLVDDGNFYDICFWDPASRKFVLKFLEEPAVVKRTFETWQHFLAYKLMEIAESEGSDERLATIAGIIGFRHTDKLRTALREIEGLSDKEVHERSERFIRECTG